MSMRKITWQAESARESIRFITKEELNLRSYKIKYAKLFTNENK